jgi:hypothetical protein
MATARRSSVRAEISAALGSTDRGLLVIGRRVSGRRSIVRDVTATARRSSVRVETSTGRPLIVRGREIGHAATMTVRSSIGLSAKMTVPHARMRARRSTVRLIGRRSSARRSTGPGVRVIDRPSIDRVARDPEARGLVVRDPLARVRGPREINEVRPGRTHLALCGPQAPTPSRSARTKS